MTETKFYELTGVEIFDVGIWNGFTYDDDDLDEMCVNFDALSKLGYDFPAKLSHDPEQRLISNSELPAAPCPAEAPLTTIFGTTSTRLCSMASANRFMTCWVSCSCGPP